MDLTGMDLSGDLLKSVPSAAAPVKKEPLEEMPPECAKLLAPYFAQRDETEREAGARAMGNTAGTKRERERERERERWNEGQPPA